MSREDVVLPSPNLPTQEGKDVWEDVVLPSFNLPTQERVWMYWENVVVQIPNFPTKESVWMSREDVVVPSPNLPAQGRLQIVPGFRLVSSLIFVSNETVRKTFL